MKLFKFFAPALCVFILSTGCARAGTAEAEAELINAEGEAIGAVLFREKPGGPVEITMNIHSLSPGRRAVHIHESPCESLDFSEAGGHFNPGGAEHGFLNKRGPHAGDLPNIMADEDGSCRAVFISNRITLKEGEKHSILRPPGTSVVIHAEPDDYFTDPAGKAGERIACGAIRPATPGTRERGHR